MTAHVLFNRRKKNQNVFIEKKDKTGELVPNTIGNNFAYIPILKKDWKNKLINMERLF